jgi:hypothetical protein
MGLGQEANQGQTAGHLAFTLFASAGWHGAAQGRQHVT